jgi:hypothetical protein
MYLFETGLGEVFKPRQKTPAPKPAPKAPAKQPPKGPQDRLVEIYVHWDLWVPFTKDFTAFGQEMAKAIGRHVSPSEKTTANSLLRGRQKELKAVHDSYAGLGTAMKFVLVRTTLRFTKTNHTGLDWLYIETPPLPTKDTIK